MSVDPKLLAQLPQLKNDQSIPLEYLEALKLSPAYMEEYQGYIIVSTTIALSILDAVMVGLRFWSRWIRHREFRWDDGLILASLLLCLILNTAYIVAVKEAGLGRHFAWLLFYPDRTTLHMIIVFVLGPALYVPAAATSKLALLHIYQTVFVTKQALLACKVLVVFVILSAIAISPVPIFQCIPIDGAWDLRKRSMAQCIDVIQLFRYATLPMIITNIALILIPIPEVWRIQVSRKARAGILGIFMLGSCGLFVSITRMAVLYRPTSLDDPSWNAVEANALIIAETSVYLISTCMLQFPPLLKYLFSETGVVRIGRSGVFILASLQPQARSGRHAKPNKAWNNSQVNLRRVPSDPSLENGSESVENRIKDEIVITSEFTVSYGPAESSEINPLRPYDGFGTPERLERAHLAM